MKNLLLSILFLTACSEQSVPTTAPFLRNKVLNGAMAVDQNHKGSIYVVPYYNEVYSLDQWRACGGADGTWSVQQMENTGSPFLYSLKATVMNSRGLLTNTDNHHIEYPIEGRNIVDMQFGKPEAKFTTLSFWVRASKAGVKPLAFMNGLNTRSLVTSYTISAPNIWQKVIVTFPGDILGTWQTDDFTFGLKILWALGVGTAFTRGDNLTWMDGASWNQTGTDQLLDEPEGSYLELTGVQYEIGPITTEFNYLPYQYELKLLERYYKVNPDGSIINMHLGGS